jgi:DNA replication and repair protein RecF
LRALQNALGVTPLLLLDDPFAELDSRRASRVLGLLSDSHPGQIFLTVPRMEDVPAEFTRLERFTIARGVLTPLIA